jgi:DNA-binding PadR family transcriptional regulator
MRISNCDTALLGLLSEGEKHPYSIEQDIRERDMRSWTDLSMSQIYKSLHRLEEAGLVASRAKISPENRTRLLYRITQKGVDALRDRFAKVLSGPEPIHYEADVALYNLGILKPEEQLCLLAFYRTGLEKQITEYETVEQGMREMGCGLLHRSIIHRRIILWRAEVEWLDELVIQLKEEQKNAER